MDAPSVTRLPSMLRPFTLMQQVDCLSAENTVLNELVRSLPRHGPDKVIPASERVASRGHSGDPYHLVAGGIVEDRFVLGPRFLDFIPTVFSCRRSSSDGVARGSRRSLCRGRPGYVGGARPGIRGSNQEDGFYPRLSEDAVALRLCVGAAREEKLVGRDNGRSLACESPLKLLLRILPQTEVPDVDEDHDPLVATGSCLRIDLGTNVSGGA